MTVRTRLVLTIIGIAVLLAIPAVYGANRLGRVSEIAQQQRESHAASYLALGRLQASLSDLERYQRGYIVTGGDDQRVGIEAAYLHMRRQIEMLAESYPQQAQMTARRVDALEESTAEIFGLMSRNEREEATNYFEQVKPRLSDAQQALDSVALAIDRRSRADVSEALRISAAASTTTLLALAAGLAVAFALGLWTTRTLTTPLRRLREAMANVAGGDYVVPENLPYGRHDEIGDLARSFSWMTEHLAKLDKMKAEFISIATHELKTPINVISGYVELVEEGIYGPTTDKQASALQSVREQTTVLTRLVNQLLDISRLEAGGLNLDMHEVAVRDVFDNLERSFAVLAEQKRIQLDFEIDPSLPATIEGDSDRLRDQVLGNLITNALKFTPEGGQIGVRAWAADDELCIEVRDSGVGIPHAQLPYIFDKYYQIGQQARAKGAGLGLAIARDVVEAHGGRITVESAEGVGTTFRITLPLLQSRTPSLEGIAG